MSRKFTFVTFSVRDGDNEYFDYTSFYTSDFQKLSHEKIVAYFYLGNMAKNLEKSSLHSFFIDERIAYIYSSKTITLIEHAFLEKVGILNSKPRIIFKNTNNIIQLSKRRKPI